MKTWILSRVGQLLVDFLITRFHKILQVHSLLIFCLSVLTSACIAVLLIFVETQNDPIYLFKETSGHATKILADFSRRFPINHSSNFDIGRVFTMESFGRIIIRAKDGGNVLRPDVFQQIVRLDQRVKKISVHQRGLDYTFLNICSKNKGQCHEDAVISIFASKISAMSRGHYSIRYPYEVDSKKNFKFHFLGSTLAEVDLDENSNVKGAKVLGLMYFLDPTHADVVATWQREFLREMSSDPFDKLALQHFTKELLKEEYSGTLVLVTLLGTLIGTVSLAAVLIIHWPTRPELFLVLLGSITTICSGVSGIGMAVFIFGCEFSLLQSGIFLVLLVSSYLDCLHVVELWTKKSQMGPEAVLRDCGTFLVLGLGTVAVPFSLALGLPFQAVRIAAVPWLLAIIIHFFFQNVAISLWISWQKIPVDTPLNEDTSEAIKPFNRLQKKPRTQIKWNVFLIGIGIWIVLITLAGWGVHNIEARMDPIYFYRQTSPVYKAIKEEDRNFADFLYRVHVVVDQPLDYSQPEVQESIQQLVDHNPYSIDPDLNESWLKYYLLFLRDPRSFLSTFRYNVTSSQGFIDCLREVFFKKVPIAQRFVPDVIFNDNFTHIVAARFFVQLRGNQSGESARPTYRQLREFGASFPFKVIFYHFMDPYMAYLDRILWIVLALVGGICFAAMLITLGMTANFILSLSFGLGIFGWHICLLGSFPALGIFLNIPTCLLLILLSGVGLKYGVSVLISFYSAVRPFKFLLSTSFALLLGSIATLVPKSFIMVADKIMICSFLITLLYLTFFVFPLLIAARGEKLRKRLVFCKTKKGRKESGLNNNGTVITNTKQNSFK